MNSSLKKKEENIQWKSNDTGIGIRQDESVHARGSARGRRHIHDGIPNLDEYGHVPTHAG